MPSPPNDPSVEQWFRRFAAARCLPAEERAAQHERQHSDALAARKIAQGRSPQAAWQIARIQLSDPARLTMKLLLAFVLMLSCAPATFADAASDARQAIGAAYARIDAAAVAADPTIYTRLCTPEARFLSPGQPPQTLEQITKQMTAMMAQARVLRTHTALDMLTLSGSGGRAVVLNTQTADFVFNGQPLHDVTRNKDTWTHTPTGWRLALSEQVSDRITPGAPPPTDLAQLRAVVAQLRAAAVPLAATDPSAPLDDLAPVGALVGGARIVALGEASHGTREFFQMKHRLLEYLVTRKGFTVFALEADWPETLAVDQYVKTGRGDPRAALAGLYFWTWNTEEVLDLIEWMRAYNAAPGPHATLSFSGFDLQTPDVALMRAEDYVRRVDPPALPTMQTDYAPLRALMGRQARDAKRLPAGMPAPPDPATAAACVAGAAAAVSRLDARRAEYVKASSADAFLDARQNALIVAQSAQTMTAGFQDATARRDRLMADNVRWLAEQKYPGQKIVLWAHNGHVGAQDFAGHKAMGAYLRADYGSALCVLGFAFSRGEVRALRMTGTQMNWPPVPLPVPPAADGTGDALLHRAGLPRFLLDFRRVAPDSPLGAWLSAPHPFQLPGAAWDPSQAALFSQSVTLRTAYDGLIYIDESHASRALPFPKRTAH